MRAAFLALILLLMPLPLLAHAQLQGADPAASAVIAAAPDEVTLTFSEPVRPLQSRWFAPDGTAVDAESHVVGNRLIVTVPDGLAEGTQALSWRVVSDDGHPVGGIHVFSIGFATGVPEAGQESIAYSAVTARLGLTLALVFGVGGMVWAALSQTAAPMVSRIAAGAIIPAAAYLLAAQAMDLAGSGREVLSQAAAWQAALTSSFGLVALIAVFTGILALTGRYWLVLAAWPLAALSYAVAGHAARSDPVALMAPLVFAHGAAVILWAGALPGLLAGLRSPDPAALMTRFSRIAVPLVGVVALSGVVLAWRQIGTIAGLTGTAYGWVFMAKIVLVLVVLVLAARHRLHLTPALATGIDTARSVYWRSLRWDIAAMVAILILTATFRVTPPPRASATLEQTRAELHLHGPTAMADIALIPGRPGQNWVEILPLDGAFQPLTPLEISLLFSRPAEGLEAIIMPATIGDDGVWHAGPIHLPQGGAWDVVVDILIGDFEKALIGGEVTLLP